MYQSLIEVNASLGDGYSDTEREYQSLIEVNASF